MSGVRRKPHRTGKYQGWFTSHSGKRIFFTGTRSRRETLLIAQRLDDEARQIRLGYRPAPDLPSRHLDRTITDIIDEYLSWGTLQGGKHGAAWEPVHARKRAMLLHWWIDRLRLEALEDLLPALPNVERALQSLAASRSRLTVRHYGEALKAFSRWCTDRDYLPFDPFSRLILLQAKAVTIRRALMPDEIRRLLQQSPPERALLYTVALASGLRAKELRSLQVGDLDKKRSGLQLRPEWTKNRQPGFQPLPQEIMQLMASWAESGAIRELYAKYPGKASIYRTIPEQPLLYVPSTLSMLFQRDCIAAGIPLKTGAGVANFHALRVTYTTLIVEAGATVKEAQALARHSTPALTMGLYARTREQALHALTEKVGEVLENRVIDVHQPQEEALEATSGFALPADLRSASSSVTLPKPPTLLPVRTTNLPQNPTLLDTATYPPPQISSDSPGEGGISPGPECAISVHLVRAIWGLVQLWRETEE